MIRQAICHCPGWEVSECELTRPQPSYTFDTVRYFRDHYGSQATLCWLVGADAVPELPRWHRIDELLDLCRVCILYRAGFEVPSLRQVEGRLCPRHIKQLCGDVIASPLVDISSTKIREGIARGQDVGSFLPPGVWGFIRQNKLYGYGDLVTP
jgi:nicotinate-nucleotide adenylyltransferase